MENTTFYGISRGPVCSISDYSGVYRMVVLSLVFLLGTTGNGLVIWFVVFKMKKTVNSVWFLSLAIADMTFASFQPLEVTRIALDRFWPFGKFMCKLNLFLLQINMISSILQLVVISIDRCLSVVFPIWCRNHRTTRLAFKVTLVIWILAFGLSAASVIPDETHLRYNRTGKCPDFWHNTGHHGMYKRNIPRFIIFFVVPFLIIVFCYTVIFLHIRRSVAIASHRPVRMIAAVVLCFFICWMPPHIFSCLWVFSFASKNKNLKCVSLIGLRIATSLAYVNSCINPILYVFLNRDFKHKFWISTKAALRRAFTEDHEWTDSERNSSDPQRRTSTIYYCGKEISSQNI